MSPHEVVIVGGARTPMAEYVGAFKDVSAIELGAKAAAAALERAGAQPGWVDHVVMGNALQTSGDAIYGARHVGLKAGVPIEVPALTVNRLCGSGIQAVISAAQMIRLGESRLALAGGMENMTQAPHVIRGARTGLRLGEGKLEDSLMVALLDTHCGLYMAQTSDNLARRHAISREDMDAYALRSQKAAAAARGRGVFKDEIVPVDAPQGRKMIRIEEDDHLRPDTTLEGLAALKPSFGKDGFVTAGNASGIVDGAAALVVAHEDEARRRGLRPLARVASWAVAGVPPEIMGIGPVPASRKALEGAGLSLRNMDLVEVNEAFAGQYLAVEKELGLDRERTNVNGGAIALGHPLAATGTRLLLTLVHELRRRGATYGLATACIGGGQGIAMIIKREA
ncbi:MAG TPA: acetyl-CoA C-acyltransferase [Vicinamibacteria bacterium]|nr:acetyl-CoA C-acyltransferase [Vicinamibacteria bacterium]